MMRAQFRARRGGVTLPTVLVGLTLSVLVVALLGGQMVALLRHAHRLHARQQARAQLAQAAEVLASELHGAAAAPSPTDVADLLLVTDSAVEVRAPIGGGAACTVGPDVVELLDAHAAGAPVASWWSDAPDVGDVAHVHDEGAQPTWRDDAWHARDVAAVEHSVGACAAGPLAPWRGGGAHLRLLLAGAPLPATVGAGAPVHVTRRRRYVHYRAGDGTWQLGQRAWSGGAGALQPVAGPLATRAVAGLVIAAFDAWGAPIAAPAVGVPARLEIAVRVEHAAGTGRWRDSVLVRVPLDTGHAP
ncbi:MAG: type IV pilus modification PilV family protein [Gemmatirosa sp.]